MGQIHPFEKEKLICGILFTDESLLSPVLERLESLYGKTDTVSDPYPFSEISPYYDSEMQGSVKRLIVSFATCIDPAKLAAIKETTNAIEADFATAEGRRINLDPGLIGCGKLILATTKPAAALAEQNCATSVQEKPAMPRPSMRRTAQTIYPVFFSGIPTSMMEATTRGMNNSNTASKTLKSGPMTTSRR